MKPNRMFFAAVLIAAFAAPSPGQSAGTSAGNPAAAPVHCKEADIRRIEKNYIACLNFANDGVVESGIANSVKMKWALPAAQLEDLRGTLGSLATAGRTAAIRYKAYLAGLVFDSPSIFSDESGQEYASDEDLFTAINGEAQKALLGHNSDHPRGF